MRKVWIGALGAVVVVLGVLTPVAPSGANGPESSWIVTLVDGADPSDEARGLARQHGGRTGHVYEHALNGFQFLGSEQAARNLERNPRVVDVIADGVVHTVEQTAPTGVKRIEAPAAHTAGQTGSGVTVAVIDTGIDLDHPDLQANINTDLAMDCTETNTTGTGDDDQGHGTHVAGTIAAINNKDGVIGVAPAAKVVPVKVLESNGSGSWSDVICGINHVTANRDLIQVANLSLGGSGSSAGCQNGDALEQAVCNAVDAGVTVVVAAGNDSKDAAGFVPAAYEKALTVSAYSDTDGSHTDAGCSGMGPWKTCDEVFASFSNYGSIVDVMAPGVNINSTLMGGGYGTKSGTSMAAPHVAGVAALAISSELATTPADVEALLKNTGECPGGGSSTSGTCEGTWSGDPDGITEPMVNAADAVAGSTSDESTTNNAAPTASFTYACTDLTCSFTDTSSDSDGTIAGRSWAFGDGTTSTDTNPSHTYEADGTYTVTLTVVDDGGATGTTSHSVTVQPPATGGISLSAAGYKVKGAHTVDLSWDGATSTNVDIFREGANVATTANDGAYTDNINAKGGGSYTYRVCEAGTSTCSADVTVTF
jgi:subtilisin family serine protease